MWIDAEEGPGAAWRELRRLVRRAAARPVWTLGITLLVAGLLVVREARRVQFYPSRVVFRVAGGEQTPSRALRDFIRHQVFSNEVLLDLMKRHRLNRRLLEEKPLDAVEWMREELVVEVWRDRFSVEPRLQVSFVHKDPKVAYEVVCDVVELVAAHTENLEVVRADARTARLEEQVVSAREALFKSRSDAALKEMALLRARPERRSRLLGEIESLGARIAAGAKRVTDVEEERDAARLRAQLERHQLSMRFEVVEPPEPARLLRDQGKQLALLGGLAFLLLLPLVAMAVGAFDPRVRDLGDLRRLGLTPLGHVPGFPGDEVGSLDERMKRGYTGPT